MLQILQVLKRWWNPQTTSVTPPRRLKNYSSESGFQYQYHLENSAPGNYAFRVWTSGYAAREIRITVPLPELEPRYRYALAKLQLFRLLDEHAPPELPASVEVTSAAALDTL